MIQRILSLVVYFLRTLFLSVTGLFYIIVTLVYWNIFFDPGQQTPDIENYMLVIGVFGTAMTFLVTLTVAVQANRAHNLPLVVRLPSRVEYLTAVLVASLTFSLLMQLMLALLALYRGPDLTAGRVLEIPPIWLAVDILAAVLAMHASDFVTAGWSRTTIYGILAILLFGQSADGTVTDWLALRAGTLARTFISRGWISLGTTLTSFSNWLGSVGDGALTRAMGFVFWPFKAIADAVLTGFFDPAQALAPAILLLYATVLFLLAADLFASKDLEFIE